MEIIYKDTDIVSCDGYNDKGEIIRACIACNKETERKLYDWQIKYMNKTGREIGTLRTMFGLTFYANCKQTKMDLMQFIRDNGFRVNHGHI